MVREQNTNLEHLYVDTFTLIHLGHGEASDVVLVNEDLNEPTMGEKQESLELLDNERPESHDKEESSLDSKPPSADSVYILLKQALHADDYALLLDYTPKMRSMTITVNVDCTTGVLGHCKISLTAESIWCLKLLQSLICIIQLRGAILASALPWLRSLLLQHPSGIVSQESSLSALNSIYQVIDHVDENVTISLLIDESYTSDEEGSDEEEEEPDGALDGVSDFDGIDDTRE
ncbi:uncharacterized protein [Pyrus communis]|uniref:uncharacterized protein n=1 Tax=Pyrus communis TaxID=23211 RepID=UPI0035BFF413